MQTMPYANRNLGTSKTCYGGYTVPIASNNNQKIKLSQDPEKSIYIEGFSGGLNSLVSPQHLQDNELSAALNCQITEDGVLSRRQGSTQYDVTDGTRVYGLGEFTTYSSLGVATHNLLKMDNAGI